MNMNLDTNVLTANDAYMLITSDGQHSCSHRTDAACAVSHPGR